MGEVFTRRLRTMDEPAKASLGAALTTTSEPALLRSALALPAEQRTKIQNAINETFSADIHLRFETAPDLVSGIELATNGQKVGWSIADYLASLEKGVSALLKEKDKPAPRPEVKVEAKPESPKPEEKPALKPEAKAEPKPELASESKAEANAESKPKAESEPKPEVKPEAKSEVEVAPAPEAKSDPKPETKVEPKPEPKSKSE